jgi:WD40 repeat protein
MRDHDGAVLDVAVSDEVNGAWYLASVGNDYALYVHVLSQEEEKKVWGQRRAHEGLEYGGGLRCRVVACVGFGHGPCANCVVTGGWDCKVKVWDVLTGECTKELDQHTKRITDVCISQDGRYVGLLCGNDG